MDNNEKDLVENDDSQKYNKASSKVNENARGEWKFDANAPTLNNELSLDNEFSVDVKSNDENSDYANNTYQSMDEQKPKKKTIDPKVARLITTTVLSVLIIIGIAFFGYKFFTQPNAEEKMNPGNVAVTIGDTRVSIGMYNFCYNGTVKRVLQQRGAELKPDVPFSEQTIVDNDGNTITVEELFKQETLNYLRTMVACYEKGIETGIVLSTQQQADIDSEIQKVKEEAHKADVSVNEYTQKNYGEYCGLATYKKCLEQQMIASEYSSRLFLTTEYTDEDVDAFFNENIADYQQVKVGYYSIPFKPDEEGSKDNAIADAESYCKNITDEKTFEALIPVIHKDLISEVVSTGQYKSEDEAIKALKSIVETKIAKESKGFNVLDYFSVDIGSWAFDSNNAVNACTYFVDEQYNKVFIVFKMSDPVIDDAFYEETYAVRHILITPEHTGDEKAEFTQEEWDAAKVEAQTIYDEYKAGDASELSFALLAEEYSADTASTSKANSYGGIFEDLFVLDGKLCSSSNGKVSGVVDEFANWVIDENRAPADTGIIKTQFGYHIMYFKHKEALYLTRVRAQMIYEDAQKEIDETKIVEHKGAMAKTKVVKISDIR